MQEDRRVHTCTHMHAHMCVHTHNLSEHLTHSNPSLYLWERERGTWRRQPSESKGRSDPGKKIQVLILIVVQLLNHVQLFATSWTAACQASLSFTISQSLLKLLSIESVMPSNHLILSCLLFFLPSVFPSIRVFSNELALPIRWSKYWSFSCRPNPSHDYSGLISFRIDLFDFLSKGLSRVFSNTTVWKH